MSVGRGLARDQLDVDVEAMRELARRRAEDDAKRKKKNQILHKRRLKARQRRE